MKDLILPFSFWAQKNPDYSLQDSLKETEDLIARQTACDQFLKGQITAEDCLEILEETGIDIDQYVNEVELLIGQMIGERF